MDRKEVMAEVHRRFAAAEPELANGFAEHTTMGAEAMLTLGLDPSAVLSWAQRHRPVPVPDGSPLATTRQAITDELADGDWRPVLRHYAATLVGRLDAHLFHGLIRTAHATRALEVDDDTAGRAELAAGLAAWTAWAGDHTHGEASEADDPLAEILEMARRGAAAFAAAPSIFALHAVTAPMAYLLIADHLDQPTHAVAAAVFTTTHQRCPQPPRRTDDRPRPDQSAMSGLAQHWDAHPAKLVEAALRGHSHTSDAAFLDAVAAMMRS